MNSIEIEYIDTVKEDGGQRICVTNNSDNLIYKYDTCLSIDSLTTDKEIKKLITNMMKLYSNTLSQKDLEAYSNYLNNFDSSKFELKDNHIINKEKEKGFENEL